MLSAILLSLASFFLDVSSSPVYNMQPAYITANIGTTGRNIRNLPCISRKTSQSGVCMFAIDCLKSNGTHLGTCIDRFYFGSCCHIKPINDIIDNSIETSIFPGREPPERLSTTERTTTSKIFETKSRPTEKLTTATKKISSSQKIQTTRAPIILTKEPASSETTEVSYKLTTFQSIDGNLNDITTTIKPSYTTKIRPSTIFPIRVTSKPIPVNVSFNHLNSKPASLSFHKPLINTKPISNKPTVSSTTKPTYKPVISTKLPTTTFKPNLTVRPVPAKLTQKTHRPTRPPNKPSKPYVKPLSTKPTKPTLKPVITYIHTTTKRPYITTRHTSRPINTIKSTNKPNKSSSNPTKTTTRKPIISSSNINTTKIPNVDKVTDAATIITTLSPITIKAETTQKIESMNKVSTIQNTQPTKKPEAIFPSVITKKPATTQKTPLEEISTKPPSQENSVPISTISKTEVTKIDQSTKASTYSTTTSLPKLTTQSTISSTSTSQTVPASISTEFPTPKTTSDPTKTTSLPNDIPQELNISSILGAVNGNIATNEIDSEKPVFGSTSKPGLVTWTMSSVESTTNVTNEDWVPITSPDGWVLLPNVVSPTGAAINNSSAETPSTQLPGVSSVQEATSVTTEITTEHILSTSNSLINDTNVSALSTESSSSTMISLETSTIDLMKGEVNMSDFTDVCGRRMYPEGRIVGGEKASFGSWPWQISLRQWRTSTYLHKCGAALLNENWAITAAHCVDSVPPNDLLLRLGEHDLSTETEPYLHQERRVQIVASHPQFDPRTFEYDLALLRFYEPVKFQPNIIPVCVPQTDENFVGRTAHVTGWGRLYEDGPLPSVLQEVSVPVINNTLCESMYRSAGYIEHIPHIFICAGWRRGGFDSCEGDSGGPMVIQRPDKRFLLAGVISWGIGCAEPNQPGVYTRISEFRDWINQILQF